MSAETFDEQVARLRAMAEPDSETWDLSDNDRAAIVAVLARLEALEREAEP